MPLPERPLQVLLVDRQSDRRGVMIRLLQGTARREGVKLRILQRESALRQGGAHQRRSYDITLVERALDVADVDGAKVLIADEPQAANGDLGNVIHVDHREAANTDAVRILDRVVHEAVLRRARVRPTRSPQLVVIGSSTGGPEVLAHVLKALPADYPLPILVVQHMPAGFTAHLANSLDKQVDIHVEECASSCTLHEGKVAIAQSGHHAHLRRGGRGRFEVHAEPGPLVNGCRPAIDVTLRSLVGERGVFAYVALTGMGEDGAAGLRDIYDRTHVVTQSESTCVVYGMPRAVDEADMSDARLDPDGIIRQLLVWAGRAS